MKRTTSIIKHMLTNKRTSLRNHAPLGMLLGLTLALSPTANASMITVDSVADPAQMTIDGNCTLREAIKAVNEQIKVDKCLAGDGNNDTIRFDSSLAGQTVTLNSTAMLVERDTSIDGGTGGAIILKGNRATPIVRYRDKLTVNNLVFRDGKSALLQSALTLTNPPLNVFNCHFTLNTADDKGAAIDAGKVFVTNSYFNDNTANIGGAIHFTESATIEQSTFEDNNASSTGGAISTVNNPAEASELIIRRSQFISNSANMGGAVSFAGDNITLTNNTFKANQASTLGGALNLSAINMNIKQTAFNENEAGTYGAAVYLAKKDNASDFDVLLMNSQFYANTAPNSTLEIRGSVNPPTLSKLFYDHNSAVENQSDAFFRFEALTTLWLSRSFFQRNNASDGTSNPDMCSGVLTGVSMTVKRNFFDVSDADCLLSQAILPSQMNIYENLYTAYALFSLSNQLCYRFTGESSRASCVEANIGLLETSTPQTNIDNEPTYMDSGFDRGGLEGILAAPLNPESKTDIRGFDRFFDIVGYDYPGDESSVADIGSVELGDAGNLLKLTTPTHGRIQITGKNMRGDNINLTCDGKRKSANCIGFRSLKENPWTLTAIANAGYTFTGWSGCKTSTDATIQLANLIQERRLFQCTAHFEAQQFTINAIATPVSGGSVTCRPATVSAEESTVCTAEAAPGHRFVRFDGDCDRILVGNRCAIDNVVEAKNVTAVFEQGIDIDVQVNPEGAGVVQCTPSAQTIQPGDDLSCTAIPFAGYQFDGFGGACQGQACAITNVTQDQTITANFSLSNPVNDPQYTVTTSVVPANGGDLICTPNPVDEGESVTCKSRPNAGFTFAGLDGSCRTRDTTCTLSNVTANQSVTAYFVSDSSSSFLITTLSNPQAGGSLICTPNPVAAGQSTLCIAESAPGYTLTGFKNCDRISANGGMSCRINSVQKDTDVTAIFAPTSSGEVIFINGFE